MTRFLRSLRLHHLQIVPEVRGWLTNFGDGVRIMGEFVGKECSPIFAQRVFRTYRVVQLHSKLWAKHLRPLSKRSLLSFILVSLCEGKESSGIRIGEIIRRSELVEHMNDLDFIHELTAATVVCSKCKDRLVVDKKVENVKYCGCTDPCETSCYDRKVKGYAWSPFVETADLLIWRMPHPDVQGLFMYKVYGYYDDISPEDFLNTQLDMDYRRKWDDTVLTLEVVEKDDSIQQDVIHWEMKWPTMFCNRDYVFARRHLVDKETNTIVVISKAVAHPTVPCRKGVHRVKEYWSVMQVTAVKGLKKPGVEFGLTYFDNPGVALPQWLTNWAAMTAIPDFLDKQRNATRAKKRGKSIPNISSNSSDHQQQKTMNVPPSHQSNSRTTDPESSSSSPNNPSSVSSSSSSHVQQSSNANTEVIVKREILSQFFKENILQNAQ